MLYVKQVQGKGRGVFSDADIKKGDTIETSPVIILSKKDSQQIAGTLLDEYIFNWNGLAAIGLGLTSMYNHDDNNNAQFLLMSGEYSIIIQAIKDIEKDTEICINYRNSKKFP